MVNCPGLLYYTTGLPTTYVEAFIVHPTPLFDVTTRAQQVRLLVCGHYDCPVQWPSAIWNRGYIMVTIMQQSSPAV